MFFKKKKPNRLYVATKSKWYNKPRTRPTVGTSRKILSLGLRTKFSVFFKDSFLYLIAGLIFLGLIFFLVFSSKFSINKIDIARNNLYINSATISTLLAPYKGDSIFFFSKSKAQELIQKKYPEFSKVEIRKLLPDRIKVELETYDIIANVKAYYTLPKVDETAAFSKDAEQDSFDKEFGTTTTSKKQLNPIKQEAQLNSIGQAIFDREVNPDLMTITIEGLSQPIEDRQIIVPKEDMAYITDTLKYFHNIIQTEIKQVKYFPIANEVHLTTDKNLTLWLLTKKPYKEQLDRFNTIYKAKKLDKVDIAYMDLRVTEKVIYCPRGTSCDK